MSQASVPRADGEKQYLAAEFDIILNRAKAEFLEMPGLQLTEAQAARLWSCGAEVSFAVLQSLTQSRFLMRGRNGRFTRG